MTVLFGSIIVLFEIIIIVYIIFLTSNLVVRFNRMKKENEEWKSNIDGLYKEDIRELVKHSKEVLSAFENYIK